MELTNLMANCNSMVKKKSLYMIKVCLPTIICMFNYKNESRIVIQLGVYANEGVRSRRRENKRRKTSPAKSVNNKIIFIRFSMVDSIPLWQQK